MPSRKKRATPRIDRMKDRGLTRWEVLDRLDGEKNRRVLDKRQYEAMGFTDRRIDRFLTGKAPRQTKWDRQQRGGPTDGPIARDPKAAFDQSAYDLMAQMLDQYGLGSLAGVVRGLVSDGITDQASLTLALQDTKEWKQRFIGNEGLKKNGIPALSVAEYLATERSYAQIMKNHGLPQGFYDDPDDFGKFIGNAVAPAELEQRVKGWSDLANRADPAIRQQLKSMGMTQGDMAAFFMDPERAAPLIQRKYQTTLIGASARRAGLVADNAYAEKLAGMGLSEEQAQAGYSLISENLDDLERLGDIHGEGYNQRDFEGEVFEGGGEATKKRKRLASRERATFSGRSGVGQGSLRQSSAGQY